MPTMADLPRRSGKPSRLRDAGPFLRIGFLEIAVAAALLAAVSGPARGLDRPRMFDDYILTSWTHEDGLFGGWIVGIAQDRHGYLWIATVSGVVRFDGVTFENYRPADGTRLPQRSPSTIVAASDGSMWVGYSGNGGVYRIQNGHVTAYGPPDGLGRGRVTALLQDVDGAMVAATRDGLFRLAGPRWKQIGPEQGLPDERVQTAYRDRRGALWVGTPGGVFVRRAGRETFEPVGRSLGYAPEFSQSADGTIWTTDPGRGFARFDRAGPRARKASAPQLPAMSGYGYRLMHDRIGNLWVATLDKGLWFVPDGGSGAASAEMIGTHDGLSNDSVRVLFEDREGDVWAGPPGGRHRFARRRVTAISDLGIVRAVAAAPDGSVWAGTAGGLVRLSPSGRYWFGVAEGLPSADVRALHVDRFGKLWVGTAKGVGVMADGRFTPIPLEMNALPTGIYILTTDASGGPWLSSEGQGLFGWRDGRLVSVAASAGLDSEGVASVESDRQGRLWLITQGGGLGYLDRPGRYHHLRPSDEFHRSDLATYEDDGGALWFGGGDRLSRFKDGKLESIDRTNGLPVDAIRAIVGDTQGHLWIGTSAGIIRLAMAEFDRALADPGRPLEWRAYDFADGLAGMPVRTGYRNAVRSRDGRLWFVTDNGLTVVEPERLASSRPAPAVRIARVTANGRIFEPPATVSLPPRTTHLEIDYTAPAFVSPRQVRFRHRLEGLEDVWVDAGTRRQVSYTNLRPGTYRFHVMARSSEGIWSEQGDSISFSIAPTFYQTRWFLASGITGTLVLLFMGWRLRLRHVHREFALVLSERSRVAREIHDTLLQSLAGLELQVDVMSSQLEASSGVKQQLERVRRQIQRDVSEARQSIWDLRSPTLEARDLPSALRELGESVASSSGLRFEFHSRDTPCRCAPKVEEHILRIGREALSNAVRHAQATVVRMELEYQADSIVLRVSDDGRGFDVVEAARADGRHWGLKTMQERAQAIGGHLTLMSGPGTGTALEMIAPLMAPSPR